ncbi:MAG: hypothetical protein CL846_00170 [Crocinitomicaceae bacterium]|nr:hypothetical protein [Crocinitomicaceae bacterium]
MKHGKEEILRKNKMNYRFQIILFGLFFLINNPICSQETCVIKGKITDFKNNKIIGANILISETKKGVISNENGEFLINIPIDKKTTLLISHINYTETKKTIFPKNDTSINVIIKMKSKILKTVEVEHKDIGGSPIELIPSIDVTNIALPSSNIESLLPSLGFGVRQNNELSSGFNVRGGNFDENLIYVNGIEVYRPFLARAGQQEGLSFINPSMIDNILFSAGGFDAVYGDKLSSVLDITYKEAKEFGANFTTSLLGGQLQVQDKVTSRLNYNIGLRYRTNSYLLGALDTKGEYRPRFGDFQGMVNYYLNEKWKLSLFGTSANNLFSVKPQNRETNWGSINEALRFTVYYEGQENTQFKTNMGAISLINSVNDNLTLKFFTTYFQTDETENFDVLGEYRLDELERDLSSDEYGEIAYNRGVGAFLHHARNSLNAQVINAYHNGTFTKERNRTDWGIKAQHEEVSNIINEWYFIDSAKFSIPHYQDSIGYTNPSNIPYQYLVLNKTINANNSISSNRLSGHLQHRIRFYKPKTIRIKDSINSNATIDTSFTDDQFFTITGGIRGNYWTYNNEFILSPRVNLKWKPAIYKIEEGKLKRKDITLKIASGYYYQPPFYRAARNLNGELNPQIRAQKSIHFVAGGDMIVKFWNRPFKIGSECYYKILRDIIPYEIDNIRVNYYGENKAKGYSTGLDIKINGEFVKGIQSYASLSWLKTQEDINNDHYYQYFNAQDELIINGYTQDQIAVDSTKIEPGYIPRPTDQRLSFSLFFQDQMPDDLDTEKIKWSTMKVNLNLLFGTRLPYGPPGDDRYTDTLRSSLYRRIDIGFSKDLIHSKTDKSKFSSKSIVHKIESMWIAFEVFNLLDISNTTNYTWIRDISGRQYSVPSFLTSRRLNLKLVARF